MPGVVVVTVETVDTAEGSGMSVVRVQGPLADVARPACQAVLHALAVDRGPVVCDLTRTTGPISAQALVLLAAPARHTRDWPGTPIGFACPPGHLRFHLARQAGPHVVVTQRVPEAVNVVQNHPRVTVLRQQLPAIPQSAAIARDLVAKACQDWGRPTQLGPAGAIMGELVNNAVPHARTDLQVTLAQCGPALRLSVGERSSSPSRLQPADRVAVSSRGVFLVSSLAQSWGVLPTSDGNKVVWAVLTTTPPLPPAADVAALA